MITYEKCPKCGVEMPPITVRFFDGPKYGSFYCPNGHRLTEVDPKEAKSKPKKKAKRSRSKPFTESTPSL